MVQLVAKFQLRIWQIARRECSLTARLLISEASAFAISHGWDAGVIYEETTATLLCGDLFMRRGGGPPFTECDIVGPAMEAEDFLAATRSAFPWFESYH